jgi:hypothetical protein
MISSTKSWMLVIRLSSGKEAGGTNCARRYRQRGLRLLSTRTVGLGTTHRITVAPKSKRGWREGQLLSAVSQRAIRTKSHHRRPHQARCRRTLSHVARLRSALRAKRDFEDVLIWGVEFQRATGWIGVSESRNARCLEKIGESQESQLESQELLTNPRPPKRPTGRWDPRLGQPAWGRVRYLWRWGRRMAWIAQPQPRGRPAPADGGPRQQEGPAGRTSRCLARGVELPAHCRTLVTWRREQQPSSNKPTRGRCITSKKRPRSLSASLMTSPTPSPPSDRQSRNTMWRRTSAAG